MALHRVGARTTAQSNLLLRRRRSVILRYVVAAPAALLIWAGWQAGAARRPPTPNTTTAFLPPASPGPTPPGRRGRSDKADANKGRNAVGRLAQPASGVFQSTDAAYNPTWLQIEENTVTNLNWMNPQTGLAAAASGLYLYDIWRIAQLAPPGAWEVVAAGFIYLALYMSRYQEVRNLDPHYQVSFYASFGWTFYAFASLLHAMAYSPDSKLPLGPVEAFHGGACTVYLGSCIYFYKYHWGRQFRHFMEGRLRPWFVAGLASLTFAHGLSVGHIWKMLEDPGWFPVVNKIYPDEWRWVADTRLLELYLTAAALFLVILHIRGVLTGTKNAAVVFFGTVIVPTGALFYETCYLKACSWQHYFMVGPKHW